jgi:transcriptional regulator with GAF, ATPase, and Fis domain
MDSQRALILQALAATSWVGGPLGTAAHLGLKRTSLISRIKKLGIYQRGTNESRMSSTAFGIIYVAQLN